MIATHGRVMRKVARLCQEVVSAGVIAADAVFGAVAQMRYAEAVSTMDADILVALPTRSGPDILRPIYEYCTARGYRIEGEAIRVGEWPAQFIPASSPLNEESMREAEVAEIEGVPLRVVRADHLALIALSTDPLHDGIRFCEPCSAGAIGGATWTLRRAEALQGAIPGMIRWDDAMDERIKELLEKQAAWQRSRAALSWEEKLRLSLVMRETQRALSKSGRSERKDIVQPPSSSQPT